MQKNKMKEKIRLIKSIEYHKNKKIDVLTTYWNLKKNGFNNILEVFFKEIGFCNCPVNALNHSNKFRDYLKEVSK